MRRFWWLLTVAAMLPAGRVRGGEAVEWTADFHPGAGLLQAGTPELSLALGLLRDGLPEAALFPLRTHLAAALEADRPPALSLPRARFLLGLALSRAGLFEEAARRLDEAAGLDPALEGHRLLLLGEARMAEGRHADAADALAGALRALPPGAPERRRAVAARAECLIALDRPALALALLERAAYQPEPGRLEYLRGRVAEAGSQLVDAAEAYRRALVQGRDADFTRDARQRLDALLGRGVGAARPTAAERLARVDALLDACLADQAEQELDRMTGKLAGSYPARYARARVSMVRRDYARAAEQFGTLADESAGHPDQAAVAGRSRAKALAYGGDIEQALTANQQVARDHPDTRAGRVARYYAAYLSMVLGDWKAGVALFTGVLSGKPGARRRRNARWYLAWCLIRLQREEPALAALAPLARSRSKLDRGAAAYWRARVLGQAGKTGPAEAAYRDTMLRFPGSYYAALARQRLGDLGVQVARLMDVPEQAEPPVLRARVSPRGRAALDRAALLARHGLFAAAAARLDGLEKRLRSRPAAALLLADLAGRLGDGQRAYRFAARAGLDARRRAPTPATLALWRGAYPRTFRGELNAAAERHGCERALLFAVMRQESAFDPGAVSRVGARGLLQLMPETGARIAAARGIGNYHEDWLFQPASNADLAAWYLAALTRKFKGNLALVVASYNGGTVNVENWLKRFGGGELDRFVEEIPFDETRGYVKKVLSGYAVYRSLYFDDPAPLADLPRRVEAAYPGGVEF